MRKTIFITAVTAILLFGGWAQAGVSVIKNGSFENDGRTINPVTEDDTPQYWGNVNIPSDRFGGYVSPAWSTHPYDGDANSLTLYSKYDGKCNYGDMAMVSQRVYLEDVNKIIFDLELSSSAGGWDPSKRSAIVLIDGIVVWDSNDPNDCVPDENGECRNAEVNDIEINDANSHTLSLAIKSNVTEAFKPYVEYRTRWDFVKFDTHCGGFGYLPQDLNRDCYIDFFDFAILAGRWLQPDPDYKYDLFEDEDNVLNEFDLMVFADYWLCNSYWQNWQSDDCYEVRLLATDLNYDGIVNFIDFAILADGWGTAADYSDISVMAEEWLQKTMLDEFWSKN